MPRILRIINRLNLGGPTYNAAYLSKYLPERFETVLAAGMKEESEESSEYIVEQLGLKPIYIPDMKRELSIMSDFRSYRFIRNLISRFKPDIVHTHAAKAGTLGRLAAIHAGVPVIVHTFHGHVFHSYFSRAKTQFYLSIERYLAARSSAIIAISELQKRELVETYRVCNAEKLKVIPLGFDLYRFTHNQESMRNDFRKKYAIADDVVAIGIIGRLVPVKNHSLFLHALKKTLLETTVPVMAFIIGDGDEMQHLQSVCATLQIPFRMQTQSEPATVTFTSWIKNVEWAIAGMDIIALTSLNEGTPVSLIEAQAAGKAVVSTNVGGIADVVIKNKTAFLVPSRNEQEFAVALSRLVNNASVRNEMGTAGKEFVGGRFSYERLAGDMTLLYDGLLKGKKVNEIRP